MGKKPKKIFTKEECAEIVSKCKTISDFSINFFPAYYCAKKNNWLDEICSHMKITFTKKYWTKELCQKEADKYSTRGEFVNNSSGAYCAAIRNGWLDEICSHMIRLVPIRGYWQIKENCIKAALSCENIKEFRQKYKTANNSFIKNGWVKELNNIFQKDYKKDFRFKENCIEAALNCKTRTEFRDKYRGAYKSAKKNGWLYEIYQLFPIVGNKYKRLIYAVEFPDNNVYIGLTYNLKIRMIQHTCSKRSQVYKHIQKTQLKPFFKECTEFMDITDATIYEGKILNSYIKNGWNILNKAKTGGLGGNNKREYEKEDCLNIALMFLSKEEFNANYPKIYRAAYKFGWLDEICSHMEIKSKKEIFFIESLKYSSRRELRLNNINLYNKILINKWMDEFFSKKQITKEECQKIANQYVLFDKFKEENLKIFYFLKKNGWTKEVTKKLKKIRVNWNIKEKCHQEALKYKTRFEFGRKSSQAYKASYKNGWLDEICSHMIEIRKPKKYWNKETCLKAALECHNSKDFCKKYPRAYRIACENKWMKEIKENWKLLKNNSNIVNEFIPVFSQTENSKQLVLNFDQKN